MRRPSITIVLRGDTDRFGRKTLYLSYAWRYKTNYISLGWNVVPKDWIKKMQSVQHRAIVGGAGAARVNADLNSTMVKAQRIVDDLIAEDQSLIFSNFKDRFVDATSKSGQKDFLEVAEKVLKLELTSKEIAQATYDVYSFAVKKFVEVVGKTSFSAITRVKVLQFKTSLSVAQNENIAAQYTRNVGIVYRKIVRALQIPDNKPFDGIENNVERMSGKKKLSDTEFGLLRTAFLESAPGTERAELLRRFLLMSKGLRFSDTCLLSREFYHEFSEDGINFRYFTKPSQKTGEVNIVPIMPEEADVLLQWQPDGKLFSPITYNVYYPKFKTLSKKIIGRAITTHYGRHYAGDSILNTEGLTRDDVQKMLGIASADIADIYAQRDVKAFLRKYYAVVANK